MDDTEQSITDRFEQIVAQYADRVSVQTRNFVFRYKELNEVANRLARTILACRGDGREPVALLFEHDSAAMVGILAVLKAGKFYVPVDPRHPGNRNRYVLSDAQAKIVVTNTRNLSLAREFCDSAIQVLNIDTIDSTGGASNLGLSLSPDALAYVMYTSGSTGQPKGVMQNHRNVLHRTMVYSNTVNVCADDRVALLYSYSSAGAVRDIFGALLNGAALLPFDIRDEGWGSLADWLIEQNITLYNSAATVFRHFASSLDDSSAFPKLRSIHLGSETIYKTDVELYKAHFSQTCTLVARLGSTEISPIREFRVHKGTEITGNTVPAGYAVGDTEVLVVDAEGKECGFNEIGEIAVQSRYLFPGYWRRPDLTRTALVRERDGEGHIFRTGDMGRMLSDGCLEHLGRKDFQVKIKGHRVEIGEIEAVLAQHGGVREAAVATREDRPGEKRLVAYVVSREPRAVAPSDLRAFAKQKLPDHMIPSAIVMIDALPLTPNGKLDRARLPAPQHSALEAFTTTQFVAPRNMLERELIAIWESILGIRPIGAQDNFFDLGGDSLTALQLIARIAKTFDRHIPPATLFHSPTVHRLAEVLRQEPSPESCSSLVPIHPTGSRPPFFWIHGDSSTIFLPRHLGPDQPLYGLEHQSQDGRPAVHTRVETIAAYYLREIRKVQSKGPYFLGGYSFGCVIALEVSQQLRQQQEEVTFLALLDPPSLRGPSSRRSNTSASFADSARDHLRALSALRPKEKIVYFLSRVLRNIRAAFSPVILRLKRGLCKIYVTAGRRLPLSLRSTYILGVYARARARHVPRHFRGRVILFKGTSRLYSSEGDWEQLIEGHVEIHRVTADHESLREHTHIHTWAETLKVALSAAQSSLAGQGPTESGSRLNPTTPTTHLS